MPQEIPPLAPQKDPKVPASGVDPETDEPPVRPGQRLDAQAPRECRDK
jgi:hypothetical protein